MKGGQVRLDPDGAHARTTTTMGDAEGLVQVQVADVRANVAWAGQTNLHELSISHGAGPGQSACSAAGALRWQDTLINTTQAGNGHSMMNSWSRAWTCGHGFKHNEHRSAGRREETAVQGHAVLHGMMASWPTACVLHPPVRSCLPRPCTPGRRGCG